MQYAQEYMDHGIKVDDEATMLLVHTLCHALQTPGVS